MGTHGKVGVCGMSYPGFYASAALIDHHPALVAASPQAPIADWFFDDVHRNGAFSPMMTTFLHGMGAPREGLTDKWPDPLDLGTTDGHRFFMELGPLSNFDARYFKGKLSFWNHLINHPNYDMFWEARNIIPHLKTPKAAVLIVGGWYDNEDPYGTSYTYRALNAQDQAGRVHLVMGPWRHGGWLGGEGDSLGDLTFGFATTPDYDERVGLPFFKHHLKGGPDPKLPEAMVFEIGAQRWRRFDHWPPQGTQARALYLQPKGTLSWEAPTVASEAEFISDPAKPVPYAARMTPYWSKTFLAEDQRFAAWRPDVLVFETAPLERPLTVVGRLRAQLFVSTDQGDADWVVKIINVWPGRERKASKSATPWKEKPGRGGLQEIVQSGVIRGRFREGFATPKPFTPNMVTPVSFELLDVMHTFQAGHRIQVQIQSSWFPYIDRNPQRWVDNIFKAKAEDFVKATHKIYASPEHPSHISLSVLPTIDE